MLCVQGPQISAHINQNYDDDDDENDDDDNDDGTFASFKRHSREISMEICALLLLKDKRAPREFVYF